MAWARLDDGFGDHPKVLDLIDTLPELEGAAAIGLWTLALTYAHATQRMAKEPGFIPRSFARSRARVPAYIGDRLVGVGLWEARDGGWFIHDYGDYLPSADLSSKRAEAGKRGAQARWGKNGVGQTSDDDIRQTSDAESRPAPDWAAVGSGNPTPVAPETDKEDDEPARADGKLPFFASAVPSVAIEVPSEPDTQNGRNVAPEWPSWVLGSASDKRPNVTGQSNAQVAMATCHDADGKKCPEPEPDVMQKPKKTSSSSSPRRRGQTKDPEHPRFTEFWDAYAHKVGIGDARKAFNTAIANGADPATLIAAAGRYARHCQRTRKERKYIKQASGWLNSERWHDDLGDEQAEQQQADSPLVPQPRGEHQSYRNPIDPNAYSGGLR